MQSPFYNDSENEDGIIENILKVLYIDNTDDDKIVWDTEADRSKVDR